MANVANHNVTPTRIAYLVTYPASPLGDGKPGTMRHEFNTRPAAEKLAKAHGVEVQEVERDTWDAKPGTKQGGYDSGGRQVGGRWTGRLFTYEYGIEWTCIEVKVAGQTMWLDTP